MLVGADGNMYAFSRLQLFAAALGAARLDSLGMIMQSEVMAMPEASSLFSPRECAPMREQAVVQKEVEGQMPADGRSVRAGLPKTEFRPYPTE
jgi:hypothetical protein